MKEFTVAELRQIMTAGLTQETQSRGDPAGLPTSTGQSPGNTEREPSDMSLRESIEALGTSGLYHRSARSFSMGMIGYGVHPALVEEIMHKLVGGDGGTRSKIPNFVSSAAKKLGVDPNANLAEAERTSGFLDGVLSKDEKSVRSFASYLCGKRIPQDACERLLQELNIGHEADDPMIREAVERAYLDASRARFELDYERTGPITAQPFIAIPLKPRDFIYKKHYLRGFVSVTFATGGTGKTMHDLTEAISMALGRDLLDGDPIRQQNVWYANLEDPEDEIQRRVQAVCKHYDVDPGELAGRFFTSSARGENFVVARQSRDGPVADTVRIEAIEREMKHNKIDVLFLDPFVQTHRLPENDNGAMNFATDIWRGIADRCGASVELVAHTRKANGKEVTVADGRGAGSVHDAVRSARTLNPMQEGEATEYDISDVDRFSYYRVGAGKFNNSKYEASRWYRRRTVSLENATDELPADELGVPEAESGLRKKNGELSQYVVAELIKEIKGGDPRDKHHYAKEEEWVGCILAEIQGWEWSENKGKIQRQIENLIKQDVLEKHKIRTAARNPLGVVRLGPKADTWLQCHFDVDDTPEEDVPNVV